MPKDLQALADYMRQNYSDAGEWWESQGRPELQNESLPDDLLDDLLDDFKQMAGVETAGTDTT